MIWTLILGLDTQIEKKWKEREKRWVKHVLYDGMCMIEKTKIREKLGVCNVY